MSYFLVYMAEISNIVAILSVLLLLMVMLFYLYRLTTSHDLFSGGTSTVFYPRKTQNIPMVKVQNPFTFNLTNINKITLDEVHCIISSECPCAIYAYWAVDLYQFHYRFAFDWLTLKSLLSEDSFLIETSGLKSPTLSFDIVRNQAVNLKPPAKIRPSDLGKSPRQKYPLVILMVRDEDDPSDLEAVVVTAIIIHIRDEESSMETRILSQHLKQANGRTCCLKPLYIPESDNSSYENSEINERESNRLCVVCQSNPITHVLLPCRHTCICERCFPLIDKCPLCRSIIQSFFLVSNDAHSFSRTSNEDDELPLRRRNI